MENGTIARPVPQHGAGFIRGQAGEEVYFHWTAVGGPDYCSLRPGMDALIRAHRQDAVPVAAAVRRLPPPSDVGTPGRDATGEVGR